MTGGTRGVRPRSPRVRSAQASRPLAAASARRSNQGGQAAARTQTPRVESGEARLEEEADRAGTRAMTGAAPSEFIPTGPVRSAAHSPRAIREGLHSPAQPLDPATRAYFEPRFGRDFGGVRVHTGAAAAASARRINAKAYTAGQHIVFGAGRFSPRSAEGGRLLAHELAHVVQQSAGPALANQAPIVQREAATAQAEPSPKAFFSEHFGELWNRNFKALARAILKPLKLGRYAYVREIVRYLGDDLDLDIEDNVGSELISMLSDPDLDRISADDDGRLMLNVIYEAIITGSVTETERKHANRVLFAGARLNSPDEYAAKSTAKGAGRPRFPVFPVSFMPVFGTEYATPHARLLPSGKIRVSYPVQTLTSKAFAEDVRTLPNMVDPGTDFEPDEIVGIRSYEEGGDVVPLPALALLDYSNQAIESTSGKIIEVSAIAFTLGYSAPAAVGMEGTAATVSRLATALKWADRVAMAVGVLSIVVRENKQWLIKTFPTTGRWLVRATEIASTIVAIYGVTRLAAGLTVGGYRWVKNLRQAAKNTREEAAALQLASGETKVLDKIDNETDALISELEAAKPAQAPASPAAAGGSSAPPAGAPAPAAPAPAPATPSPPKPSVNPIRRRPAATAPPAAAPAPAPRPADVTSSAPKRSVDPIRRRPSPPRSTVSVTPQRTTVTPSTKPAVEVRDPASGSLPAPVATGAPAPTRTYAPPMRRAAGGAPRETMVSGARPHQRPQPVVEPRRPGADPLPRPVSSASPDTPAPLPQLPGTRVPRSPQTPPRAGSTEANARQAIESGLEDPAKGRLGYGTYGTKAGAKAGLGSPADTEAIHIVPQTVYRALGRNPGQALTRMGPKSLNQAIDKGWVSRWNTAVKNGEQIARADVEKWVGDAIDNVPPSMLTRAEKDALQARLSMELDQLGLDYVGPGSVIVPKKP